jgi:hypothetical protein
LIVGEGHKRDVPAGQIGRQDVILLLTEIMDVGQARQLGGVDLGDRSDQHEVPVGAGTGRRGDQRQIDPLVDDPVEAEPGMGDGGLIGRFGQLCPCLREMLRIDAGREAVEVVVLKPARLVEPRAAREHDVGRLHQLAFERLQLGGGETEARQLVHAVEHDGRGFDVPRAGEEHRRVEPKQRPGLADEPKEIVEQPRQRGVVIAPAPTRRNARPQGDDIGARETVGLEIGEMMIRQDGLFEVEHTPRLGEALHHVLRALTNRIPAKMREADERRPI